MTTSRNIALAAILLSSVAATASAQPFDRTPPRWDRIGSVDFSFRPSVDVEYGRFGGRVESLALTARNSDVRCRSVTATFGNGQTREIFRGTLPRGRDVAVDLPGRERMVRQLTFNCRSLARRGAIVDIAADVGRYQAEWRRSPDWDRMWSRMFDWDRRGTGRYVTDDLDTSGWFTLASENFEGRFDQEMTFTGWRGRDLEAIALRPLNDDARCRDMTVTFANGQAVDVALDNRDLLPEDRVTTIDLPGFRRDVMRIDMNCRAEHGGQVTMQVLASR